MTITYFTKEKNSVAKDFNAYLNKHIALPKELVHLLLPSTIFADSQYAVYPYFFNKAFKNDSTEFLNRLCISGFLYFKYLLCVDSLLDKDVSESHENHVSDNILLSRSHVYHEESIKILSFIFDSRSRFWKTWKTRNHNFYKGVLLDKIYNPGMPFEVYKLLSVYKCSFLKATLDGLYFHTKKDNNSSKNDKLYKALLKSFDHLAIGNCLQDDFEDFKKDFIYKKNNHGHVLLNHWLSKRGKAMHELDPEKLEKFFYISTVAEQLLEKSRENFTIAINAVQQFQNELPEYIHYLEAFRNKVNLLKVTIEAHRVSMLIEKVKDRVLYHFKTLEGSIARSGNYIEKMQSPDGSWYDISNRQGLSNIWSTAFIAMNLNTQDRSFRSAAYFLSRNKQNGLWGYNKNWIADFDSATCSLSVLNKARYKVDQQMKNWWQGQTRQGGFTTYPNLNRDLVSYMGIGTEYQQNDWTREHVCVSALAYYFLSGSNTANLYKPQFNALKKFILNNITDDGVWQPYWWTSHIYPTTFILKGMIKENKECDKNIIHTAIEYLLGNQLPAGGFACDILKRESVFYTSLVLDVICQDKEIFKKHRDHTEAMKDWILARQYKDGAFENTNFLLIPNYDPNLNQDYQSFKVDKFGSGGSITGEVAGLFSTAVAYRALSNYQFIKNQE